MEQHNPLDLEEAKMMWDYLDFVATQIDEVYESDFTAVMARLRQDHLMQVWLRDRG